MKENNGFGSATLTCECAIIPRFPIKRDILVSLLQSRLLMRFSDSIRQLCYRDTVKARIIMNDDEVATLYQIQGYGSGLKTGFGSKIFSKR